MNYFIFVFPKVSCEKGQLSLLLPHGVLAVDRKPATEMLAQAVTFVVAMQKALRAQDAYGETWAEGAKAYFEGYAEELEKLMEVET